MSFFSHPRPAYAGTRVLAVEPMVALTDTFAIHSPAINTEVNVPFFVAVLRTLLGPGDPDLKKLPTHPPRPGAGNRESPAAS
jgi:hypothetical protein